MKPEIMNNKIKFGDYIIVAVILISALFIFMGFAGKGTPKTLTVSVNGEIKYEFTLPCSVRQELNDLDYPCIVVIENYNVFIENSTCPGGDCEHSGEINGSGQSLVCLPNRLILTLSGDGSLYDAVLD